MSWVDAHFSWIIILGIIFITSAFISVWYISRKKAKRRTARKKVKGRIYLIADTHFDHANIIRYCKRPFPNVRIMNRVLIRNWNNTVKPRDTVYFLGDWAFGRGSREPKYWVRKLNGHIFSIKGSHDSRARGIRLYNRKILNYGGHKFLLIHNPDRNSVNWNGWVIHGHKHNNSAKYPFINGRLKTINVGVELTNYKPVSIDFLLSLNIDSIRRMETVNSKLQRK